jgi:hypothetical protein
MLFLKDFVGSKAGFRTLFGEGASRGRRAGVSACWDLLRMAPGHRARTFFMGPALCDEPQTTSRVPVNCGCFPRSPVEGLAAVWRKTQKVKCASGCGEATKHEKIGGSGFFSTV